MGTTAHVVLTGPLGPDPGAVLGHLADLEARWSRFRPTSELSLLSTPAGSARSVTPETTRLVELAVHAWQRTDGRFDPTVLDAVVAAGYDRTFDELRTIEVPDTSPEGRTPDPAPAPGCDGVTILADLGIVVLPQGVGIDPGGIGKGLAADLAAHRAVADGADGALVSVGGDLRVAGRTPPGGWPVEIDHGIGPTLRVDLLDGAVATSSVLRRRWNTPNGPVHHVVDPRTGGPTRSSALACTVITGEAWWAEVLATALLVAWDEPDGAETASELVGGDSAVITASDGSVVTLGPVRHVVQDLQPRRGREVA